MKKLTERMKQVLVLMHQGRAHNALCSGMSEHGGNAAVMAGLRRRGLVALAGERDGPAGMDADWVLTDEGKTMASDFAGPRCSVEKERQERLAYNEYTGTDEDELEDAERVEAMARELMELRAENAKLHGRLKKNEADYADLTRRAAATARELGALRDLGPDALLRAVKELLDKLTEAYPPPAGKTHGLAIGRSGRLQLSVWDGDEQVPLSFDEGDGDLDKGAERLLEDVRRLMGIYRQARELSGRTSGHFSVKQEITDDAERTAVLSGVVYVMRRELMGAMGCRVRLGLAERFLNWYPRHTKLYIRGQQGKDWDEQRRLDAELALELGPFLRQLVDEEVGIRLAEQHLGVGRIEKALKAWQSVLQRAPAHETLEAIGETASLRGAERVLEPQQATARDRVLRAAEAVADELGGILGRKTEQELIDAVEEYQKLEGSG